MAGPMTIKARAVMEKLFAIAVERGASDVHLVVGKPPLLRIDGLLMPVEGAKTVTAEGVEELVFSLIGDGERQRFMGEKELDIAHETALGKRFRINLHWEKGNPALAARAIPTVIPTMEALGMSAAAQQMTDYPNGLVLITGPSGSGKSTTLAAMIDKVNASRPANIITLEDPIEFLFQAKVGVVRQRQFGQDFLSFSEGLKHMLRQDPDVIMVGEMRDTDTMATTLTLAEAGHLVFATLHTYGAAQTMDRLIDAFPSDQQNRLRSQLSMTLRGVISQQLVPKIGGGRIAAREVMVNTPAVANLIRDNKIPQIRNVLQTSSSAGMFTLAQDLKRLVAADLIERETAEQFLVGGEKDGATDGPKKRALFA